MLWPHPACANWPISFDKATRPMILCINAQRPLPPGTWPKASDEADGNTGRPQPGFFRMHRPGHFSLVIFPFSIPDPQGIGEMPSSPDPRSPIFFKILCGLLLSSWPKYRSAAAWFFPDHRQKIFRTLPQMAWGGELFSSDIMWWLDDWIRLILHQLPLTRIRA